MKTKKIFIVFLLIVFINTLLIPKTFAFSKIIEDGKKFLEAGENNAINNAIDEGALQKASNSIYNILLSIAIVVAVIIGAVLGIQFIFESAEGKAKITEALIPYIVGCFVVFGAFGIWKIAVNTGESIEGTVTEKYGNGETVGPTVGPIVWDKAKSAKDFIDSGGDLKDVSEDILLAWYGQLSRLSSGNQEIMKSYYNKVSSEVYRRGIYCSNINCGKKLSDDERANRKCSACGKTF